MNSQISPSRTWRYKRERYMLIGSKCMDCGRTHYPPRRTCQCGSRRVEEATLPHRGRLVSYTVTYNVQEGYRDYAPLIFGVVELEDGTRILAQITDVSPGEVKTGMEVESCLRRIVEEGETGLVRYGIKFRPTI